jgi:ribosomal protein L21E
VKPTISKCEGKNCKRPSGGARVLSRFRVNAPPIESIIDDFAHGGGVRIDIHSITRAQMPHNSFSGNVSDHSVQLRIAPSLDVVNSKQPLIQRQVFPKSHDYVHSSYEPGINYL